VLLSGKSDEFSQPLSRCRVLFAAAAALCLVSLVDGPAANGQSLPPASVRLKTTYLPSPQQRAAYDAALSETFKQPADPTTLARFAEAAIRFGDMEGAISALERLLLIEGDQPELKLELGVLYYRMGSRDVAAIYLDAARSSPGATPKVQERAETFLKAARR